MKYFFLFILALIITSCKKNTYYKISDANLNTSILNPNFMNSIGIYSLSGQTLITEKEFEESAKKHLPNYVRYKTRNLRRNELGYYIKKIDTLSGLLTPPKVDYLNTQENDLSAIEKLRFQKCETIFAITFYGSNHNAQNEQEKIQKFINNIVAKKDFVIVDFGTLEYFNYRSWHKRRVENIKISPKNIIDQIVINIQEFEKDKCRVVTFGMEKFCLPDISISNFPCNKFKEYRNLLILATQSLAENRSINKDSILTISSNAIKNKKWKDYFSKVEKLKPNQNTIKLKSRKPLIGDKNNTQLEIVKNNTPIAELVNQLSKVIQPITYVSHNKTLLETSKKAKKKLPILKSQFNTGLLKDNFLLLKAPFLYENVKKEWIWVKILEWKNTAIIGTLYDSSIHNNNLKKGHMVIINEEEVFDYITLNDDNSIEGNETEKFISSDN